MIPPGIAGGEPPNSIDQNKLGGNLDYPVSGHAEARNFEGERVRSTMPHDVTLKAMNTMHRLILKLSGGRLGGTTAGMPVFEVTTIGRRSGQSRSVMLTSPLSVGSTHDEIALVASRGGDDTHPAWYLNMVANPLVSVVSQASANNAKVAMRARVASAEERKELWPKVVAAYKGYGAYQAKTDREIPVVILAAIELTTTS
jgi:deazaflavin-dependent oxidoreductase (nitroreductase family)